MVWLFVVVAPHQPLTGFDDRHVQVVGGGPDHPFPLPFGGVCIPPPPAGHHLWHMRDSGATSQPAPPLACPHQWASACWQTPQVWTLEVGKEPEKRVILFFSLCVPAAIGKG